MNESMTSVKMKYLGFGPKVAILFLGKGEGGVYVYSNQALFPFIGSF